MTEFLVTISERTDEECWSQFPRRDAEFAKSSVFNAAESRCRKYCYNGIATILAFGLDENPLFDSYALLTSLGRELIIIIIIYYERKRHYNPILNIKVAAGSRGEHYVAWNMDYHKDRGHCCTKKCPRCYVTPSCEFPDASLIRCETCNPTFYSTSCFERHRAERSYDEQSPASETVKICATVKTIAGDS